VHNKRGFFKEAIKSFKTSGSITPSSKYLIKTMLKDIDFKNAKVIVEYGPGNGVLTKRILEKMNGDALLVCFEINPKFHKFLSKNTDKRLLVLNKSAENVITEINKLNITQIDYCISSLPLAMLPNKIGKNILNNTKQLIKVNGYFIQFQYSLNFYKKISAVFNKKNVQIKFEPLNIPPAFVYKCKKI
jgi:phospholipid N-methyltransferase